MHKKEKQWHIDRAVTDLEKNENRIRKILEILSFSSQVNDKNELLELMVITGVINSPQRYKQSFQTFLKDYGLIESTYKISEVSHYYLDNKINFKELILLQTFKRQYKRNESFMIRPLVVMCMLFIELYKYDRQLAWIDEYDYFTYITEIVDYSEIPVVVKDIIKDKKATVRHHNYKHDDFDAWISLLIFLGFIKIEDEVYRLCENSIDMCTYIIENHKFSPMISKDENWLEKYGSFGFGIPSMLKKVNFSKPFQIRIETDVKKILELYLFKGYSFRKIEDILNIMDNGENFNGFFSQAIINSFGIVGEEFKGIWKGFDKFRNIIAATNFYDNEKLFDILISKEVSLSVRGINKIYYGVPGCGKSYKINSMLKYKEEFYEAANKMNIFGKVNEENIYRTTFYLEYTYSDFVGQLMPHVDGDKVTYISVPGPFTLALERAYNNPSEMVYLIIEEINRGNAAAIFGDLFQLLDRLKESNEDFICGDSEYPINNVFIEDYLAEKNVEYKGDKIYIPHNLTILATMNTCDQNVFPLDTAFKRRWEKEKVISDVDKCPYFNWFIPLDFNEDIKVTWADFVKSVNQRIISTDSEIIREDKQIGAYFIGKSYLCDPQKNFDAEASEDKISAFCDTVLEYIWNDVSKLDRLYWFDGEIKSYDDIIKIAKDYQNSNKIFNEEFITSLRKSNT